MALADVADEIAVYERETETAEISKDEVARVYTSLYHTHIPKLADADIVDYNRDRNTVALSSNADRVELLLEAVTE